jgi:DinB superfamily
MAEFWRSLLTDQLHFYMNAHLRPRLVGLSDDEYFWEPVDDCWSIHRLPDGSWSADGIRPGHDSDPPPVTTIGWRLAHLAVANFGARANAVFGGGPADADMFDERNQPAIPGSADAARALLDSAYEKWQDGIAGLDDEELTLPIGRKGSFYADDPMAALVMHVNREAMHHGGEIGVLRDLYSRMA